MDRHAPFFVEASVIIADSPAMALIVTMEYVVIMHIVGGSAFSTQWIGWCFDDDSTTTPSLLLTHSWIFN
jgi:hypothetical protein